MMAFFLLALSILVLYFSIWSFFPLLLFLALLYSSRVGRFELICRMVWRYVELLFCLVLSCLELLDLLYCLRVPIVLLILLIVSVCCVYLFFLRSHLWC